MSKATFLEARAAFSRVIGAGFNDQTINAMIASMANPEKGVKFTDAVISLAPMSMEKGLIRIDTGRKARNNTGQFWGQGASGTIQKGASGLIYKKIVLENGVALEKNVLEVFMEAWIQTVLGLDKKYGSNVSQIRNIYRDISIVRGWEKKGECILYITMDLNKYKIEDYFHSFGSPTVANVKPQLLELGKILQHFEKKYAFKHRDFHQGNVMFAKDKSIKLIDFGRSCMVFDWTTESELALFGMPEYMGEIPPKLLGKQDARCFSLDLLTLLVSIIEYYKDNVSPSLFKFLNDLVTSSGGKNLFSYAKKLGIKKNPGDPDAAFWQTYPDKFMTWSDDMITELVNCPTVRPDGFIAAVKAGENASTGGRLTLRRRKNKKKNITTRAF